MSYRIADYTDRTQISMNPLVSDPISPSFLITPNAAQEFISLQSAEITRLRTDVEQLKAQVCILRRVWPSSTGF